MSEAKSAPMVVVFPRGQLMPKDKERLTKAGIIAVEAEMPRDVCQLHLAQPLVSTALKADAILTAAIRAMASFKTEDGIGRPTEMARVKGKFVDLLNEALKEPQ